MIAEDVWQYIYSFLCPNELMYMKRIAKRIPQPRQLFYITEIYSRGKRIDRIRCFKTINQAISYLVIHLTHEIENLVRLRPYLRTTLISSLFIIKMLRRGKWQEVESFPSIYEDICIQLRPKCQNLDVITVILHAFRDCTAAGGLPAFVIIPSRFE